MTPTSRSPIPGEPSYISPRTRRFAIGYLREDLSTDLGYDAFRLRLTAMAHGYTLKRVLLADSPHDSLHLLTMHLNDDEASALLIPELDHLPDPVRIALRTVYDIIACTTVLP